MNSLKRKPFTGSRARRPVGRAGFRPFGPAALAAGTLLLLASCGRGATDAALAADEGVDAAELAAEAPAPAPGTDLWVMELRGPVKECHSTVYYDVTFEDEDGTPSAADSTAVNTRTRDLYFDRQGNYVASADERIRRDATGRIVGWRDARPNNRPTHPGILADTLAYRYLDGNVLVTDGMGEYAVAVYDDEGRIAGQYSRPDAKAVGGEASMSAYNIYRARDAVGNWTERLTVWVSQTPLTPPHVTYTLERRTVTYYRPRR